MVATAHSPKPLSILLWIAIYSTVLIWSIIAPKDGLTWVLEATPALIAALLLAATYRQFQLTPLTYQLILFHCLILFVGAHYTYAEVPLFTELQHWLGTARNDYDKLGHFAQGVVPAIVAREIIIRLQVIRGEAWQAFFILCFVLAVSATYELLEWAAALLSEEAAEAFLGTQGYEWDTQSDMFWALSGAIFALLFLSRLHNRQLAALPPSN
ncbi:DUF2238 domain-containing protein [Thiomicrorhabdus sp. zzn3]|uniref:DUF2238 domain-containing protein n=1 Tax=Thiomicrorhabdus sp. zzn3 TaxID=3039775 RepID=UPI0024365085|nr:DUF2238 domain-containing protein [Thiomicrorhabdus sp. zzn3]MDG6777744.1 DUF2238 domain-containing protein [Thiomicrorhabdus sp. zzn3]